MLKIQIFYKMAKKDVLYAGKSLRVVINAKK